jgi:ribonuclease BN (tRNA processing enzyme)
MKLRVLGASGAELPGKHSPAFLIDNELLLDAGTIGAVLNEDEQYAIRHILISHAHLDHIKSIPSLADNIVMKNMDHTVLIQSIEPVIKALMDHLLNDLIWPDFTKIPTEENPVYKINTIEVEHPFEVNGYTVTAYNVNHTIPAIGYVIEDSEGRRLLYTGDTGSTDDIWRATSKPIHAAIIEVSMPNSMEEMAVMTKHLTASLLAKEVRKMDNVPQMIYITHPKPQYLDTIIKEINELGLKGVRLLEDGEEFNI